MQPRAAAGGVAFQSHGGAVPALTSHASSPCLAQAREALKRLAALLKRAASLEIQAELSREAAVRAELSGLVHRAGRVRTACYHGIPAAQRDGDRERERGL